MANEPNRPGPGAANMDARSTPTGELREISSIENIETEEQISSEFTELKEMLDNRLITKTFFNAMKATMEDRFKDVRHAVLESAMVDVAMMREDFKAYCDGIERDVDNMDARSVLESFKTFMIDIENVLFRNGVEIYRMPEYHRILQKIDRVTETDDPEKDLKVRESLSDGYSIDQKVIYPERVDVYRFKSKEGR